MKKSVLFIHGGGEDAYVADEHLVVSLRTDLGSDYAVSYPRMPNPDQPRYTAWKRQLVELLSTFDGEVIVVGHSLGGSVALKYLSDEPVDQRIVGLFMVAAPYWGFDGWAVDEYTLSEDFAARLSADLPIFCYHSRDDDIVPFDHLGMYAARLPQATLRAFDGRGHQFANDLSEVAADITHL